MGIRVIMCLLTGSFVHKVFLLELFVYISRKLPAMRKSIILISFLSIFCITSNARNSYTRPTGLHTIENGSIYSIYQDELGALWMNTNYGICRYNGHSLEFVHDPLPISTIIGNGSDTFYIPAVTCILQFNVKSPVPRKLTPQGINISKSVYHAEGDSLWIGTGQNLYIYKDNIITHIGQLPAASGEITAITRDSNRNLLLGTSSDGLYCITPDGKSQKQIETNDNICSIFNDSKGNILIGLKEKGIIHINPSYKLIKSYLTTDDRKGKRPIRNARTFCEDSDGKIYVGTLDGLFAISEDGHCHTESSYAPEGHSICSLLRDRSGNIWIGTFYSGAYICEVENSPFKTIKTPVDIDIRLINAMIEDSHRNIWIITDHYGVFMRNSQTGEYRLINDTANKKLKAAWYDSKTHAIWLGDYFGSLYRYNIGKNEWKTYTFNRQLDKSQEYSIYDIDVNDGIMYLGTNKGIFMFDPYTETEISRHIDGYDSMVFMLKHDKSGKLWIGGNGLLTYDKSYGIRQIEQLGSIQCAGLDVDHEGNIYIATIGYGIIHLSDDSIERFDNNSIGLSDDYTYLVKNLGSGRLLTGTRTGVSIIDIDSKECFNYNALNGLALSSAREGHILEKENGEVWIGGTDGIVMMHRSEGFMTYRTEPPVLDRLYINNQKSLDKEGDTPLPFLNSIKLKHDQCNIAFEIATFNYSGITPVLYEYKMHGLDHHWTRFTPEDHIVYTNLSAGKYRFEIRSADNISNPKFSSASLDIKVAPVWYASIPAIILYILLTAGLCFYILNATYSRLLLSQKLKDQEKDNQDRIRFFVNLSHELRTPLTLISAQLELLLRSNHSSQLKKKLHNTWTNTQKMQEIVSNLLDFEKQNQGYTNLTVADYDLCLFLQESKEAFAQYANYRNISLSLKLPTTKIPIVFDATQMQKVIYNLLLNAFKFTPDGGAIDIELKTVRKGKGEYDAVIRVSDTGCGISEKALEKIFNPFYQEKKNKGNIRNTQGTGIGLALCKGIIDLHHGTITAENNQKNGARFTITLPMGNQWFINDNRVVRADENTTIERYSFPILEKSECKKTQSDECTYKMLIIEDDYQMRGLLVSIFEGKYEITEASDGAEGIEKAQSTQPDIIISDVQMPVMDGLSLCSKLRQDFSTCHIPIILLTAHTSVTNNLDGINVGADEFIPKPFSVDLLEAKCTNLLENRRILRKKFSQTINSIESITKTDKDADFLKAIINVIEENILTPEISVPFLCDEMHMSKSLLTRKLKGITGSSPREFIENIRMKYAARLLCDGAHNISDVSYELGFSSPKYFTIRFKKIFGVTPSQYIEDNTNA